MIAPGLGLVHAANVHAANSADLDLKVTFSGSLSVSVDGLSYSTRNFLAKANALVVPSSATVENDGTLIETWELSVSTVSGGGNWALQTTTATAPDVDQYAFQALFTSSATSLSNEPGSWSSGCPSGATASDWDNYASIVSSASAVYTSGFYSDPNVVGGASGMPDETTGIQNGDMLPFSSAPGGFGSRGLCARIYMPSGTAFVGTPQVMRLTVTAAPGN
jgi:hypothetical protein